MIGLPYGKNRNHDNKLSRFHTTPERNGRTDRQICYIDMLTRGKNRILIEFRFRAHLYRPSNATASKLKIVGSCGIHQQASPWTLDQLSYPRSQGNPNPNNGKSRLKNPRNHASVLTALFLAMTHKGALLLAANQPLLLRCFARVHLYVSNLTCAPCT